MALTTIQGTSIKETNCAIQWIVIYPVDSAIHLWTTEAINSYAAVKKEENQFRYPLDSDV